MSADQPSAFRLTTKWRVAFIVAATVVASWFTLTITASTVLTSIDPVLAARLDSRNNRAIEAQALASVTKLDRVSAQRTQALSIRALRISPLSSDAAITLASAREVLAPGINVMPAVAYSEFLSRRNPLTEMYLIEHWVAAGDIPRALRSYDHLFRVNDAYRVQFLPVLLAASAQPAVAKAVARLLETRPPWQKEYYGGLLANFPGPENFAVLVRAMHFNLANTEEAPLIKLALDRLVAARRPDLAFTLYRDAVGDRRTPSPLLRNGSFARSDGLPPFDWDLTQSDELSAEIGSNPAGQTALLLVNRGGRAGPLARQLLMLRPGSYRITAMIGNVRGAEPDRPSFVLQCLGADNTMASLRWPEITDAGHAVTFGFAVPSQGCPAQWLVVQAGNPVDEVTGQQWLTDLRLVPQTGIRSLKPLRP